MRRLNFLSHPGFYILICVYITLGFLTLAFGDQVAGLLFNEDRYFENIGAFSLFAAAGISFYTFLLARKIGGIFWGKQLVYLGLGLLYFLGGGEEISWGQRIFNIEQPAIMKDNVQEEINIHNLAFFENSSFLKSDDIFSIFWFGFAIIVPAVSLVSIKLRNFAEKWVPIVNWKIGGLFLFNYFMAKVAKGIFQSTYSAPIVPFLQAVQEVKESNYELLFIFLSLFVLWDFHQLQRSLEVQKKSS